MEHLVIKQEDEIERLRDQMEKNKEDFEKILKIRYQDS